MGGGAGLLAFQTRYPLRTLVLGGISLDPSPAPRWGELNTPLVLVLRRG